MSDETVENFIKEVVCYVDFSNDNEELQRKFNIYCKNDIYDDLFVVSWKIFLLFLYQKIFQVYKIAPSNFKNKFEQSLVKEIKKAGDKYNIRDCYAFSYVPEGKIVENLKDIIHIEQPYLDDVKHLFQKRNNLSHVRINKFEKEESYHLIGNIKKLIEIIEKEHIEKHKKDFLENIESNKKIEYLSFIEYKNILDNTKEMPYRIEKNLLNYFVENDWINLYNDDYQKIFTLDLLKKLINSGSFNESKDYMIMITALERTKPFLYDRFKEKKYLLDFLGNYQIYAAWGFNQFLIDVYKILIKFDYDMTKNLFDEFLRPAQEVDLLEETIKEFIEKTQIYSKNHEKPKNNDEIDNKNSLTDNETNNDDDDSFL